MCWGQAQQEGAVLEESTTLMTTRLCRAQRTAAAWWSWAQVGTVAFLVWPLQHSCYVHVTLGVLPDATCSIGICDICWRGYAHVGAVFEAARSLSLPLQATHPAQQQQTATRPSE